MTEHEAYIINGRAMVFESPLSERAIQIKDEWMYAMHMGFECDFHTFDFHAEEDIFDSADFPSDNDANFERMMGYLKYPPVYNDYIGGDYQPLPGEDWTKDTREYIEGARQEFRKSKEYVNKIIIKKTPEVKPKITNAELMEKFINLLKEEEESDVELEMKKNTSARKEN